MVEGSLGQQSQPRAPLRSVATEGPFVIPPWTLRQACPGGGTFVRVGAWRLLPLMWLLLQIQL